jgi:hypothetical protein
MNSTTNYEVVYTALDPAGSAFEAVTIADRAIRALVSDSRAKACPRLEFVRLCHGGVASFAVRCSDGNALLRLPRSYGAACGNFGIFERTPICTVDGDLPTLAVFGMHWAFILKGSDARRRLLSEVGARFQAYLSTRAPHLRIHTSPKSNVIRVTGGAAADKLLLPERFNGVFARL